MRRKALLEALAEDLPSGTIRYSSKVVAIEESGSSKLVHLADGSILKAKVLNLSIRLQKICNCLHSVRIINLKEKSMKP